MGKFFTRVSNPGTLLNVKGKDNFIRLYAFEMLLIHLNEAQSDKRKKERVRAKLAMDCVNQWIDIAGEEYDKRKKNT